MLTQSHQKIGLVLRVLDGAGIILAWLAAYYLRFYTGVVPVTKGVPPLSQYLSLAVPVVLIWLVVFTSFCIYRPPVLLRGVRELLMILRAHLFAILIFVALTYMIAEYKYSRLTLVYFSIISGIYIVYLRKTLFYMLPILRRRLGKFRDVLIVGTGSTAFRIADSLAKYPEYGLRVLGFVSADGKFSEVCPDERRRLDERYTMLGTYEETLNICAKRQISHLYFALPRKDSENLIGMIRKTEKLAVEVTVIPDIAEFVTLGFGVDSFDGLPVISFNSTGINLEASALKRGLDIVGSMFAITLFSPLFLLISILVKFTSKGPVFYAQERLGLDGHRFKMWKFRSMCVGAEDKTGPVWASEADDRRTPIGAFLRSTSLDEIPQFWNVLCGNMSLVGPRPERPEFVEKFKDDVPKYMLRHKVKAGITGWAQVNGWRGDTNLEKRIECDLYYIQNWSVTFDVKILILTVLRGFINKNAY